MRGLLRSKARALVFCHSPMLQGHLTHHSKALSQLASNTLSHRYALPYFHSHTALYYLPVQCLELYWTRTKQQPTTESIKKFDSCS